ncbi:MAG: lipoyl(octanoyl) transferase LipB [Gemmatimonadetes bacterium]|nr:lipoyl(octanoyl) transferase LipB [Gemmatimonadota bacterium]
MTVGGTRMLEVYRRGLVPYAESLILQDQLVRQRRAGEISDTLVLLEHPHVITLGSSSDEAHVLVDEQERERMGIELFEVGRGGDVTYHGPGQVIGYPVLDLKPDRKDLHAYLRDLEKVLIKVAHEVGVKAERRPSDTGVWTESGKLASIGVRVSSGWITSHGVALNVNSQLNYFDAIVPCGLEGESVTSLEQELGHGLEVGEVSEILANQFANVFEYDIPVV